MLAQEVLKKQFGYSGFRPGQQEIIASILSGRNVLAVLPTGAGKSVCYQIPAFMGEGFSIVISPLIALMKDQVDALNKNGSTAAFINSTMSFSETEGVLNDIAFGKIKLLYVAPERLENINFAERIKNLKPSYLFVDEAHCISQWGHNFRPSYTKIAGFIDYVQIDKVSAFTATATPEVVKDIVEQLKLKDPKVFVKGFERDNLRLNAVVTKKKKEKTLELIRHHDTPAIIYTASRKNAEEISEFLNINRVRCAYYHAGLPAEMRRKIQDDFIEGTLPVIAATNAFGMGIDKPDIRLIIHYNTPGSIENYYQEIGRAGRDGKLSDVFLLHDDYDINIQNFFLQNSHPGKDLILNLYNAVCDYGKVSVGTIPDKEIPLNMEYINAYCKQQLSKGLLHSALGILEQAGYIRQLNGFDRKVSLRITVNKDTLRGIIKRAGNQRLRDITVLLLREHGSAVFNGPVYLSPAHYASQMGIYEDEADDLLLNLNLLGAADYIKPTSKESVMLSAPRVRAEKLNLNFKRLNDDYFRLKQKIDKMVDYVFTGECRFKFILNYFGEGLQDYRCGKCDKCSAAEQMPDSTSAYLKEIMLRTIHLSGGEITEGALFAVLKGSSGNPEARGFDTYGSCANYSKHELKLGLEELLSEALAEKDRSNYRHIKITSKGDESLRYSGVIESIQEKEEKNNYEDNLILFNMLKEVRQRNAKKFMQTGYIICPDDVLRRVAEEKPSNPGELMMIEGFNPRMYNKLGAEFLETIREFLSGLKGNAGSVKGEGGAGADKTEHKSGIRGAQNNLPKNIKETLKLVEEGYSLQGICALRKLNDTVVSMQIETILEYAPDTNIESLFQPGVLKMINTEVDAGYRDLKDLKSRLPGDITYAMIRIAAAAKHVKPKP